MLVKRVVYLKVTSWRGTSIGATHYYGTLAGGEGFPRTEVRLEKELDAAEARHLSQIDDWHWEKGDKTHRFASKDRLIRLATTTWRDHFPNATLLILGDHCIAEPQLILVGPEELKRQINPLARRAEREGGDEKILWALCAEWDQIAKSNQIAFF